MRVQTDELPRGIYALDYPQTDHGIVLLSYVWGDDSTKLLALDKVVPRCDACRHERRIPVDEAGGARRGG